jgi:PTH1 family peptidyl-tRNA hydrolase
MFFRKKEFGGSGAPEYLIVGLGNPGTKYAFTRHNAGFLCLELLAERQNVQINRIKFKGVLGEARLGGHRCLLLKPQTFMNNSGESVREAAAFYKIPPERILVIFDDVSLPCGRLRIRRKGSDGGHNGIKSIIWHLGTDVFPRIKLGVGSPPTREYDMVDWVLGRPDEEARKKIALAASKTPDAALEIMAYGVPMASSHFNGPAVRSSGSGKKPADEGKKEEDTAKGEEREEQLK